MKAFRTFALLMASIAVICWAVYSSQSKLHTVREHYAGDSLKLAAAEFLLANMADKYAYTGKELERHDTILKMFENHFLTRGFADVEPLPVQHFWDSIINIRGSMRVSLLEKVYDERHLAPDALIEDIDMAFEAWRETPDSLVAKDFSLFLEYVLPYRIGNEQPEWMRRPLYDEFKGLRDSLMDSYPAIAKAMNDRLRWDLHYRNSRLMWRYATSMPVSWVKRIRRGSCMHLCEYYVLILRALGFPATIDFVDSWANRSGSHCWVSIVKDDTTQFAFDALEGKELEFAYKPAKIYRRTFSIQPIEKDASNYVPGILLNPNRKDVTHLYGKTYDIQIKGDPTVIKEYDDIPYGVICTFDNRQWIPISYGKVENGNFHFPNMLGDICYMAGYYIKGKVVAATSPFFLSKDGKVEFLQPPHDGTQRMTLKRKYPRFARMEMFAENLRRSRIEASNDEAFNDTTLLFDMYNTPHDVNDSIVNKDSKFRYVRWKIVDYRTGNLAEVAFYGKQNQDEQEKRLEGKIIGWPEPVAEDIHPYHHAMDGNPDTYFSKSKNSLGYVGLDLGEGREAYITRVHFHPQSDTNFILVGDTYELCYWKEDRWVSHSKQTATSHELTFDNVPQGTLYILHDLTQGVEERPFTYENGEQVWW